MKEGNKPSTLNECEGCNENAEQRSEKYNTIYEIIAPVNNLTLVTVLQDAIAGYTGMSMRMNRNQQTTFLCVWR